MLELRPERTHIAVNVAAPAHYRTGQHQRRLTQQPVDSWAGTIQGLAMAERLRGHKGVAQRRRRMLRSNWLCEHCQAKGITRKADVVDHIRPLAHGGSDEDSNTRNLCNDCHLDAGAEQFGHRKRITIGLDGWPVDTGKSVRLA